MKVRSRIGHSNNIKAFERLMSVCEELGSVYEPSNEEIRLPEMEECLSHSREAVALMEGTRARYFQLRDERFIYVKELKAYGDIILNELLNSDAAFSTVSNIRIINSKIHAKRSSRIKILTPIEPGEYESFRNKSLTERNIEFLIIQFELLLRELENEPGYNPLINAIKLPALRRTFNEFKELNIEVQELQTLLEKAREERMLSLYDVESGLVARGALAKEYVRTVMGSSSPSYQQIGSLAFRRVLGD